MAKKPHTNLVNRIHVAVLVQCQFKNPAIIAQVEQYRAPNGSMWRAVIRGVQSDWKRLYGDACSTRGSSDPAQEALARAVVSAGLMKSYSQAKELSQEQLLGKIKAWTEEIQVGGFSPPQWINV